MSGFTTNLSNLPPGVTVADIERHFGERPHTAQCPQHENYQHIAGAAYTDPVLDAAREVVNVWDEESADWRAGSHDRIANAAELLFAALDQECACDQLAQAYAEDAAEHAREEDEWR